jgi:osmotically-inducible protein OsmY
MDAISDQIQDEVRITLSDDPRIPYAQEIAVEADGDAVVLRGTVGNFGERHAAVADARRTRGLLDVYDELQVRPLDRDKREDAEIRGAALERLMWDPELRPDYLDVQVKDGWVTLRRRRPPLPERQGVRPRRHAHRRYRHHQPHQGRPDLLRA